MDEDKIVEAVARAISDRLFFRERKIHWTWMEGIARSVIQVHKAALAEATHEPLRALEAAARVAQKETLTAPNAPGWPAVCAVLHHIIELRTIIAAALGQRQSS